jgi:hypothetical protein
MARPAIKTRMLAALIAAIAALSPVKVRTAAAVIAAVPSMAMMNRNQVGIAFSGG